MNTKWYLKCMENIRRIWKLYLLFFLTKVDDYYILCNTKLSEAFLMFFDEDVYFMMFKKNKIQVIFYRLLRNNDW